METVQRRRMSWEDYLALPEKPRAEWVAGEVVVSPHATYDHQWISRRLANHLQQHLADLFVFETVNVWLPGDRLRIPDIAVFTVRERGLYPQTTPVLVVEVLSPGTRGEDTIRKPTEYAAGGVGQFWTVDPELRIIEAFGNSAGSWDLLLHLDDATPTGEVVVAGHGTVPLDLREILG